MALEQKIPKNPSIHFCEFCDYTTSSKKDFNKHNSTRKHKKNEKENKLEQNRTKNPEKSHSNFVCEKCNKSYISKSGLWNHKKKCIEKPIENAIVTTELTSTAAIIEIIKQNQEFKTLLIEQQKENKELINKVIELSKEPRIVNNGTMTQNNNQKHFNLQFFLNDTCKDAITIKQFIDNIQISLEDLESVGRNGHIKGISEIVLKELKTLDVTKRPIHCTDLKREVIYLKEEDAWNKDDDDNTKLKNIIRTVENKSWNKIPEWQQENPDVVILDTPENMLNAQIMRNICGNDNAAKQREKIVKVIAKEMHLEKENHFIEVGGTGGSPLPPPL
jgi:hypothetical protein